MWVKSHLNDSLAQFDFYRRAFNKALKMSQELHIMQEEHEVSVITEKKQLENVIYRAAINVITELGGQTKEIDLDAENSLYQLKLLYNDVLGAFFAFYQTKILHLYLESPETLQPL